MWDSALGISLPTGDLQAGHDLSSDFNQAGIFNDRGLPTVRRASGFFPGLWEPVVEGPEDGQCLIRWAGGFTLGPRSSPASFPFALTISFLRPGVGAVVTGVRTLAFKFTYQRLHLGLFPVPCVQMKCSDTWLPSCCPHR